MTKHQRLLKTPAAMKAWLKGLKPRTVVASSKGSNEDCLVANFLKSVGYPDPCVGGVTYDVMSGESKNFILPAWFSDTETGVFHRLASHKPITARAALKAIG